MRQVIQQQWFNELLSNKTGPCVSIYMPLHRMAPISDEDSIRFRDLVEKACARLSHRYDNQTVEQMREKLKHALSGEELKSGDRDGVAVFCSPKLLRVIELQEEPDHAITEMVVAADSFHVKPLIRLMQGADRYQLLCLEIKEVRMFEGSKFGLQPLPLINVPQHPVDVAGMRLSSDIDSAGDLKTSPLMQAQGPGAPVEGVPVENYFRAVDKAVWENYSRQSKLPLIVCCDPKYVDLFHNLSRNNYLLKQSVPLNPHRLSIERLHEESWKIMEPMYRASICKLRDDFRAAKAHHQGSDELIEVAEATSCGRVGTLLVQSDAHVQGILQRGSGFIRPPELTHPSDDVLDDLAEMVLQMDGRVVVLPADSMPTATGVAAIYRY